MKNRKLGYLRNSLSYNYNNFIESAFLMKKTLRLLFAVIFISLMSACSDDKAEQAETLLTGVPADAEWAGVIDLESAMKHLGLDKEKGEKLPLDRLSAFNLPAVRPDGVRTTVAVAFGKGSKVYLTGFLDDSEAFKGAMEKVMSARFQREGNVDICSGGGECAAVCGDQFWVWIHGSADAGEIRNFVAQTRGMSFLSRKGADELASLNHDVQLMGEAALIFKMTGSGMSDDLSSALLINAIYSDPKWVNLWADFSKEGLTMDAGFINGSGRPAEFNLPLKKIDAGVATQAAPSADMFFAANIPAAAVEKMRKSLGAFIPFDNLEGLDGTLAVAAGEAEKSISGVVATNGKNIAGLTEFINELSPVDTEVKGNLLFFHTSGTVSGPVNTAVYAKKFSDSYMAGIFKPSKNHYNPTGTKWVELRVYPSGGTARLSLKISENPATK